MTRCQVPSARNRARGFSLIELMIGMVVGLIVVGSALAFTVVTMRSYGENIRSSRLTNDLTSAMNLAIGELRRSGYDAVSVGRLFTDDVPSSFDAVDVSGSCLSYRYDRGVGALGNPPHESEMRAIRLDAATGTLQLHPAATSGCTTTGTWSLLTDPQVVEITAFTPTLSEVPFCSVVAQRTVAGVPEYDRVEGAIREVTLEITGRLRADPSLSRTIENASRIRADRIQFVTAAATGCP